MGDANGNQFLSKLDVIRKRHGIQRLKINQLHVKDEEAEIALGDTDRERLIMEEEKYYENLDANKLEDEEERERRTQNEKREALKKKLYDTAPLRYKMRVKYDKRPIRQQREKVTILKEEGYELDRL